MLKRSATLFLCFLLAVPAGTVLADAFDAIVSDPPKPDPETDVPFFGDQVIKGMPGGDERQLSDIIYFASIQN